MSQYLFWICVVTLISTAESQLNRNYNAKGKPSNEEARIVFYSIRHIASFPTSMANVSVVDILLKDSANKTLAKRRMLNEEREDIFISEADIKFPNDTFRETLDTSHLPVDLGKLHMAMKPLISAPFAVGSLPLDKNITSKVLMVGLGGSQMNNFLHHTFPQMNITVVELEPTMVDIARKHFGLIEDDHHRVIVMDGIKYIKDAAQKRATFDAVFIDACPTVYRPEVEMYCPVEGFISNQTIQQIRRILSDNGSVIVKMLLNTADVQGKAGEIAERFTQSFKKCFILPMLDTFNRCPQGKLLEAYQYNAAQRVCSCGPRAIQEALIMVLICGGEAVNKQNFEPANVAKLAEILYNDKVQL